MIEPDGSLLRLGAQVVKNVTGYDLVRMHIGAFGTLGVIAAAGLKLFPQPQTSATALLGFATRSAALDALADLAAGWLQPVACDLLNGLNASDPPWALVVRAEGHPAAVERHVRELRALATTNGGEVAEYRGEHEYSLWDAIVRHGAATTSADEALLRIGYAPAELGETLDIIERIAGHLPTAICARAITGSVLVRVRGTSNELQTIHAILNDALGHVHLLAGPAALYAGSPVWGRSRPAESLMRQLKQTIDPYELFNPGRLI
ncbi:MAG: FAD-binding oxidoreductase [Oscillochloris sp.]|nr:FAD-binding oxidoreductase [Oscillochloris sp.]